MRNEDTPTPQKRTDQTAVPAVALKTGCVWGNRENFSFQPFFWPGFLVVFQPLGGGVRPKSQTN